MFYFFSLTIYKIKKIGPIKLQNKAKTTLKKSLHTGSTVAIGQVGDAT